jgi:hypothetical protein
VGRVAGVDRTGKMGFEEELANIIPGAFYKFRDINFITVTATGALRDLRGHESRGDVMKATFSRNAAEAIVWNKVYSWDLPKLADEFCQDRGFDEGDCK